MQKLQDRWNMKSTAQTLWVLGVFALTGFTILFLKKWIKPWFKDVPGFDVWYYIAILPIYNLILLMYGFLFGQGKFFWEFEKRFFSRWFPFKKRK